jgi:lipopolysaccharide transport system ATP-binding protein
MLIKTMTGFELGGTSGIDGEKDHSIIPARTDALVRMKFSCMLLPGTYFVNCDVLGTIDEVDVFLDRCIDAVMFRVLPVHEMNAAGMVDFRISTRIALEQKA